MDLHANRVELYGKIKTITPLKYGNHDVIYISLEVEVPYKHIVTLKADFRINSKVGSMLSILGSTACNKEGQTIIKVSKINKIPKYVVKELAKPQTLPGMELKSLES